MKKSLLLFCLLFCSGIFFSLLNAQKPTEQLVPEHDKYSRVKIFTDSEGLRQLSLSGVTIDHGNYRKGIFFESDFSAAEVQKIKASGLKHEIIIDDVSKFYEEQNARQDKKDQSELPEPAAVCQGTSTTIYQTPANFNLGTMGGYFKYAEFLAQIDSMVSKFPLLITAKQPIDTFHSIQGKDIFWLKISDNPGTDETEPELMYSALHHAREPASLSQLIFYMWYLLENYGTDPEVTYLVNNTEMFFVPMVNPDGYVYNQTTNPNGGGMWRKNRKNNGNGTYGIDLNRNYGNHWGYDNSGSSPDPSTDTYRGTAGFSEPETQAMKWFCENHNFQLVLNYHTYGDLFIYPWSYEENIYTPDSAYFVNYASEATRDNAFATGTANQTVGYTANGDSDDWMYGEQSSKNKIFAATPEAGPGDLGFWPASSKIIALCLSNLTQNLNMAHFALKYAKVTDQAPKVLSALNGYLPVKIQNFGLDTPSSFTVSITGLGNQFSGIGAPLIFSGMNLLEEKTDSISYSLNPSIPSGSEFQFVLSVDNGLYVFSDTITKTFGQQTTAYNDNASNMNNWGSPDWGISNTIYQSPSSSITDSPNGNYSDNDNTWIELSQPVDLSNAIDAMLTFWARWEIEPGWDYAQVQASSDNGGTWTPLCGKFTKSGNANQDEGQPLFDGMQQAWVMEEISLKDYIGSDIWIRFEMISDGYLNYDGFYFDDLKINIIPVAPDMGIDSLLIIPSAPTENDTVALVAFTTFPSGGCDQNNISSLLSDDTLFIDAFHSIGPLAVICNSVDTTVLGQLGTGTYALIYSSNDSSGSINFDTDTLIFTVLPAVGIAPEKDKFFFEFFPNPVSDIVYFNHTAPENGSLIIYNNLGEEVHKSQILTNENQSSIDVSEFPQGLYFYQMISENYRSKVKRMAVVR